MALLALAASSLARHRAKNLALGAALALTVTLAASVLFLTDALRGAADRVRAAAPDLVVQHLVGGRPSTIHEASLERVRHIDGVRSARARVWGYVFVPAVQANVVVVGMDVHPEAGAEAKPSEALSVMGGSLAQGRSVERDGEAVLGAALAEALSLRVGDQVRLASTESEGKGEANKPLRIVGTFSAPAEVYTADVVLVGMRDARTVLTMPDGEATDLAVDLTNPAEAHVAAHSIDEALGGVRIVDRELVQRIHELAFGRRGGLALAALLPAILALLVLGWDRLSSLGRDERREVAILKAVGFATRDVVFVRLSESLVLASLATALGIGAAYLWIFVFGAPGLRSAIAGFGVLEAHTPLVPSIDAAPIFGLALGIVGPFVALSIVPAWRAAIADPMDGMRG